ncbi:U3 snoRNP protein, partial [Exophiala xenobiotica]
MADPQSLLASLSNSTQSFLQPPSSLHLEALACVKGLLDPLAANVADAQKTRRDENRRKRKRGDVEREEEILQLRQVYTSGLGLKQVWEQARRVLDAACSEVEREIAIQQDQSQGPNISNGLYGDKTQDEELSEDLDEEADMLEDEDLEDDISGEESLDEGEEYEDEDEDEDEEIEDPEAEDFASDAEE